MSGIATPPLEHRHRSAAATYDAAADHFDAPPLSFWDRHGKAAIALLGLRPGSRVLDVGCGTGASALPAAGVVGARGRVIGIDVANNLLNLARRKAAGSRMDNLSFECRDMTASGFPDESFDAVVSVFSLFFVEDMQRMLAELERMVRAGGQLLVTTWGADAFQPCAEVFTEEIARLTGRAAPVNRPWERIRDEDGLRDLFARAGLKEVSTVSVTDRQALETPEDWWTVALGSGYRAEIERLAPAEREAVRGAVLKRLRAEGITSFGTNAIHAIAAKAR